MIDLDYSKYDSDEIEKAESLGCISDGVYIITDALIDSYINNNLYNTKSERDIDILRKIAISKVESLQSFTDVLSNRFENITDFADTVERILIWAEKPHIFTKEKNIIIKKERNNKIDSIL